MEVVTTGLVAPLKGVIAPGHRNNLYVIDQPGIAWNIDLSTNARTPFVDLTSRIVTLGVCGPNTFDERGLLGLAFHPRYKQNGLVYTYTSERTSGAPTFPSTLPASQPPDHQNVVAEWRVPNPGNPASVIDPSSRRELLRVSWPQFNHDGGDMAFGPDGKLYIAMGDGGGADDADGQDFVTAPPDFPVCGNAPIVGHQVDGNAQKLNVPLGKILRIDVDGRNSANGQYGIPRDNPFVSTAGALPEIWAYGFRNPFRLSFDTRSGDLYVGDVGQNDIEEVDLAVRGGNFGWNLKEGTLFFHINGNLEGFASREPDKTRGKIPNKLIDPIAQYDTHHEGHSVIGGFVYHGRGLRDLSGKYIFGDFSVLFKFPTGPHDYGRLFAMDAGSSHNLQEITQLIVVPGGALSLALLGFGQDASGEIYALGNVSGLPFPNPDPAIGPTGRVLKLVPAAKIDVED